MQIDAEDNLSKTLCQQCLIDLTYVYEFIEKCQKSDEIQRSTSLNSNETVTEIKIEEFDDYVPEIEDNVLEKGEDNVVEETEDTKMVFEEPTDEKSLENKAEKESPSNVKKSPERRYNCEICPKGKKNWLVVAF